MNTIKEAYSVEWPANEIEDNFKFSVIHPDGTFIFTFRFYNDRWNCYCELPSGEIRGVGVEPNIVSWSGFLDYGIFFETDLQTIDRNSLYLTTLYILTWS